MGLGGILASMAQGFGGSMVKIADEAWKKEAEDRKFKFYADESEKDRVHKSDEAEKQRAWDKEKIGIEHVNQVALENIKGRNKLSEIAAQARQSRRSEPSKDAVFMADSNNALTMTPNKYVVDISDPSALKRAQDALAKERQKKVKESLTPYNSAPTQYGNLGVTGFSLY